MIGCDNDEWQSYGGSCYKKITETVSWMEAREACQNDMADLVVVETEEEDAFIRGMGVKLAYHILE